MGRSGAAFAVAAVLVGGLSGCAPRQPSGGTPVAAGASAGATASTRATGTPQPSPAAAPAPATPDARPILGSTSESSLAPRAATPYLPAAGSAPAQSFAVGRRNLTFARGSRALPVRVWYPAVGTPGGEPTDSAPATGGRFPVVLFSHGLTTVPDDYAAMLTRWAQTGFVVVAPTYPHTSYGAADFNPEDIVNQCADASHVLTEFLRLDTTDDPLAGHLDADRLGAAGHSAGGITTAGLFSAERDERLTAGIILAGTDFRGARFTGRPAAMLFVHGRQDRSVTYRAGHTVFAAWPWSRAMLTIDDGGHVTTGADFEAVTGTSTEFLRWSLYGDTAAKAAIPARAAVNGVATLDNQL